MSVLAYMKYSRGITNMPPGNRVTDHTNDRFNIQLLHSLINFMSCTISVLDSIGKLDNPLRKVQVTIM